MRLNKFIAAHTEYSRRKADELIQQGQVKINHQKVTDLGTQIDPDKDKVQIKNQPIKQQSQKVYIMFHKPAGYVTTRNDEKNRPTVIDLIPKNQNLKPVGRLDLETEGLLLLTNDGEFINKLTHPRFECEKEYFVKINGKLTDGQKSRLEKGIFLEDRRTAPAQIKIQNQNQKNTSLKITIHEGRKRQIRKMFAYLNHPVEYLQRTRIGNLKLGGLEKGKFRPLTKKEIDAFQLT